MNIVKKISTLFLIVILHNMVNGQGTYIPNDLNDLIAQASLNSNYSVLDFKRGSPMMFDKWKDADLISIYDSKIPNVKFQYNLEKNNLIVQIDSLEKPVVLDINYFKEVVIRDDGEEYLLRKLHPESQKEFVKILFAHQGVLMFEDTDVVPFKSNIQYHGFSDKNRKYKRKTSHYLFTPELGLKKVKLNKPDKFLKYFPEDLVEKINYFRKKTGMKLKNPKDYLSMNALIDDSSI